MNLELAFPPEVATAGYQESMFCFSCESLFVECSGCGELIPNSGNREITIVCDYANEKHYHTRCYEEVQS